MKIEEHGKTYEVDGAKYRAIKQELRETKTWEELVDTLITYKNAYLDLNTIETVQRSCSERIEGYKNIIAAVVRKHGFSDPVEQGVVDGAIFGEINKEAAGRSIVEAQGKPQIPKAGMQRSG